MKKSLSLFLAVCISLSTIAAPWDIANHKVNHVAWDKPLQKSTVFTDPYVTSCFSYELSKNYQPNHVVQLQINFNQSVPVPYYVTVSVLGNWSTNPGYATERFFTVLFPTGYYRKVVNYPMSATEEIYPDNTYVSDYGPQ